MILLTGNDLSGSSVGGDQAAGSIDKSTHYHNVPGVAPSQLNRLLQKLSHQIQNNESTNGFVDELQFFIDNRDGESVIGLQDKLDAAGRGATYKDALRKKELFSKLLLRFERFSSAQQLFAYIMAEIHETFTSKVFPELGNLSESQIDDIIDAEIFQKILLALGEGSDHITLNKTHLRGMIFWLADKCYVRWHHD